MQPEFGSLFSGFGGLDLGLERAGWKCAWQVEINKYARRVLNKHWSDVPKFADVRECGERNLTRVTLIAGGFPCQDISEVGYNAGLDGSRSGLWREQLRIIDELRPEYALIENVRRLRSRGLDRVLKELAACGYDAEWETVSACAFGAPHSRERLFIVAYPASIGRERGRVFESCAQPMEVVGCGESGTWNQRPVASLPIRVAYGLPDRVERLRGIGNAVVPQIGEWIGKCLSRHLNYSFNGGSSTAINGGVSPPLGSLRG
jgi:DNA (cytosine-5)-methyltransferase 1